jgi:spore maturation protein SpmA
MILNRLWIGMFLIAVATGLIRLIGFSDLEIFKTMMDALFDSAKSAFEIALYLTGALCFWLGIMKVGENAGAIKSITKLIAPFFTKIFPEVPKDHPAMGSMVMNISANMLGLDNAATPLGLKAMKDLQDLNTSSDTASNAQIMFMVLNASGLTLIPVSILALRASNGAANPTDIFLPILIATYFSTLSALIYVAIKQRINLFQKNILLTLGGLSAFIVGLLVFLSKYPQMVEPISMVGSNVLLFGIITAFIVMAMRHKVNVYDSFIEGAKEGFQVSITIIPYLVAMLCVIGVFRASGAMEYLMDGVRFLFIEIGIKSVEFVDALPVAFMKPLSGSGARALMIDTWQTFGVDSFAGRLAATFQGSTETTFYVLAVYFGAVNIKNTRYAAVGGLIADFFGALAAIFVAYLFFG